jgi:ubiquinone biosynthesis protein
MKSTPGGKIRSLRRLYEILSVFIKHGFGDVVDRIFRKNRPGRSADGSSLPGRISSPIRFRQALETLGPSFIKLGQLISTRADLLPAHWIEELRKLQDQVPPEPFEKIQKIIEKQLSNSLAHIFEHFESEPIAAASVAQVHRARMKSGEIAAVKVVRPGIGRRIREDIRIMYYLADKIEKAFELGRIIGAVNLVQEFERTVFRELDMNIEAGNIEKFSGHFKGIDEIYICKVFWSLTTRSVLTMEYIPGIKVDEVEKMRDQGIDPKDIAMIGLRSLSRQLMEFGYFHADPHPGNTLVMDDGRVSLVDFGIMGYMDEDMMLQIANLFYGYAEHDYDLVMESLLGAGLINEDTMDLKDFRRDLREMSEPFYGRSLQNIAVLDVYNEVMQLVLKYHVRLPRDLLLLLKTFIQTEALGKILGSDASILEVMKPYAARLLQKGYDARKAVRAFGRDVRTAGGYLRLAPGYIHDILKQTAKGRQRIELAHKDLEPVTQQIEKGINRITVGVIIAASTIAGSLVLNAERKLFEFSLGVFGEKTLAETEVLGLTGYCIATVLGIWLILSIYRSGKL